MPTPLLSLAPLPSDSTLVLDAVIDAEEHNAHRRRDRTRINLLLTGGQDLQEHYASGSQPNERRDGTLWYDTTNDVLKARILSAWTEALHAATAYSKSLSTAGTGTFKVGGAINVNTTQTQAGQSYTLPGNTLGSNGQVLIAQGFFTGSDFTFIQSYYLDSSFGGTALSFSADPFVAGDRFCKTLVVRTGASSQKIFGFRKWALDSTGLTEEVKNATDDADLSGNLTTRFNHSGTINQEVGVVTLAQ